MTLWQRLIARWRGRSGETRVEHLRRWHATAPTIKPIARATRFNETRLERFARRNGWKA